MIDNDNRSIIWAWKYRYMFMIPTKKHQSSSLLNYILHTISYCRAVYIFFTYILIWIRTYVMTSSLHKEIYSCSRFLRYKQRMAKGQHAFGIVVGILKRYLFSYVNLISFTEREFGVNKSHEWIILSYRIHTYNYININELIGLV